MYRETRDAILAAQRNDITEHIICERLSRSVKDPHNRKALERIAGDELEHHDFWKRRTNEDVKPNRLKIWWYLLISRVFGIAFGISSWKEEKEGRGNLRESLQSCKPHSGQEKGPSPMLLPSETEPNCSCR